jgi:hypothetical protein
MSWRPSTGRSKNRYERSLENGARRDHRNAADCSPPLPRIGPRSRKFWNASDECPIFEPDNRGAGEKYNARLRRLR